MFKQAWRSYLASIHPRNIKKIKNGGIVGFWLYWVVISPILNAFRQSSVVIEQSWFNAITLTPYVIMWWSNLEHKLHIPKQMYLLPMELSQRAEYIKYLLLIKIGLPTLVGVILHVIYGLVYEAEPFRILACTIAWVSFGIGMYVCSELRSKYDRYIRYAVRAKDGTGTDACLNWMCMIYSAIFYIIAVFVEVTVEVEPGEENSILICALWYIILLLPMILMDIAIIKTRYHATIADIYNYEEAYNVLGKVKNV